MSAGGVCEVSVIARTRCDGVVFRKCGKLLYGKRFPLSLEGTIFVSLSDLASVAAI